MCFFRSRASLITTAEVLTESDDQFQQRISNLLPENSSATHTTARRTDPTSQSLTQDPKSDSSMSELGSKVLTEPTITALEPDSKTHPMLSEVPSYVTTILEEEAEVTDPKTGTKESTAQMSGESQPGFSVTMTGDNVSPIKQSEKNEESHYLTENEAPRQAVDLCSVTVQLANELLVSTSQQTGKELHKYVLANTVQVPKVPYTTERVILETEEGSGNRYSTLDRTLDEALFDLDNSESVSEKDKPSSTIAEHDQRPPQKGEVF